MLIQLKNIQKSFGEPGEASRRVVLDGIDLDVEDGGSIAIVGPSGSGKTTLLNMIGGLDHPDSGEVFFRGETLSGYGSKEMDAFRNRQIGFVFQFHHLLPQCTLMENVLIPTLPGNDDPAEKRAYAEALLKRTGIWEHRHKLPGTMSGGECQRAAVVRAMINKPSVLLADEPTGSLDGENVDILADLLVSLNRDDGLAVVLVTHSLDLAKRMEKTYTLSNGKLSKEK